MAQIKVKLSERTYPVIVNDDHVLLAKQLKEKIGQYRLFVFYDANFYALHYKSLKKIIKKFDSVELVIPSGEKQKSAAMLNKLYDFILSEKITRSDFILACGGGVTSDLVGYLAATTLRGIRWGVVSTTLLGMVDASIGGKTAVNHKSGKNLIGAFWQPDFVFCNPDHIQTLPAREIFCGLGEIVKYAGLIGEPILDQINQLFKSDDLYNKTILNRLIVESVKFKANIVSRDERESKLRMLLNLGHTFGHAIEKTLNYGKISHGEAVIIGLLGTMELSRRIKPINCKYLIKFEQLLFKFLPFMPKIKLNAMDVYNAMLMDKKRQGKGLNFILLNRPGQPFIQKGIDKRHIIDSISYMLDMYRIQGG